MAAAKNKYSEVNKNYIFSNIILRMAAAILYRVM
jgi:hypothetical protein